MAYNDIQAIRTAIAHPSYSHSRMGTGACRDVVWIYHRDESSPSGYLLQCSGDAAIVDPIIRELRNNSPLSPTER